MLESVFFGRNWETSNGLYKASLIWMFDKLDTQFQVLPTSQDKFRQFFRLLLLGSRHLQSNQVSKKDGVDLFLGMKQAHSPLAISLSRNNFK